MPFVKSITAGYVLFCVPKENQKGRRCPQDMKAPDRFAQQMPRVQRGKVSATFEAREAAGCGSLRLLCALRGTRILQAAAPTAPPCFGRWPRSSPLHWAVFAPSSATSPQLFESTRVYGRNGVT